VTRYPPLIEEGDGLTLDALSEECADAGQAAQFCLGRGLNPFNRHKSARSKFRPDVGATLAAGGADEARFDVRQPDVVSPLVGGDLVMVAAARSFEGAPWPMIAPIAHAEKSLGVG